MKKEIFTRQSEINVGKSLYWEKKTRKKWLNGTSRLTGLRRIGWCLPKMGRSLGQVGWMDIIFSHSFIFRFLFSHLISRSLIFVSLALLFLCVRQFNSFALSLSHSFSLFAYNNQTFCYVRVAGPTLNGFLRFFLVFFVFAKFDNHDKKNVKFKLKNQYANSRTAINLEATISKWRIDLTSSRELFGRIEFGEEINKSCTRA